MAANVDYAGAYACAKKLLSLGGCCASVAGARKKSAGGIGRYWSGKTADACTRALTNWCGTTSALEKEMESLAALISKTAGSMEAQEKAAAAAAQAAKNLPGKAVK
jgi:uncharacterized protein YukE